MNIAGLFVPLMKLSILLFSVSFLFLLFDNVNRISRVAGRVVASRKKR